MPDSDSLLNIGVVVSLCMLTSGCNDLPFRYLKGISPHLSEHALFNVICGISSFFL